MQIRRIIYSISLALCLAVTPSLAQSYTPTPVTVSTEKVKANGKMYYSHVVLERQTLYSISKAYGVSIADIQAANPSLEGEGLQKNSIILIPVAAKNAEASPVTGKKVEKKEEKKKENPKASKTKEGQTYVVRWFETLDSIAEKFGISTEALAAANGIKDGKIKARDVLVIPEKTATTDKNPAHRLQDNVRKEVKSEEELEVEQLQGTEEVTQDNEATENQTSPLLFKKDRLDIALVLPFKAKSPNPSTSALDFYCGVLMAAKQLSREGLNINLKVIDTADGIRATELTGADFIIGPVSPDELSKTCNLAGNTPVISPLDPRAAALTSQHENLIQVPTPHECQYSDLIEWMMEENTPGDRIILVKERTAKKEAGMDELTNILNLKDSAYQTICYSILEGRDIIEKFREAACPDYIIETDSDGKKNIVRQPDGKVTRFLIASESEAFVNDVVRNINLLSHENNKVEIYCHSKIRGYDIEAANLHDNNLHVSLAYWTDYDNPDVISFVKSYRALIGTEPTQFSFQGYDITCWFARHCHSNGNRWNPQLDGEKADMFQTSFNFLPGARVNSGVKRIAYLPGFTVVQVR